MPRRTQKNAGLGLLQCPTDGLCAANPDNERFGHQLVVSELADVPLVRAIASDVLGGNVRRRLSRLDPVHSGGKLVSRDLDVLDTWRRSRVAWRRRLTSGGLCRVF
jgi:hypothetical protein